MTNEAVQLTDAEIVDASQLETTINRMKADGPGCLHILADFDGTLTKIFVGGRRLPSMIAILRDGNYLTPDYAEKAHALYNHYYPIEADHSISKEDKKVAMEEWWRKSFALLIESGLTKTEINKAINSGGIKFRQGVLKFTDFLNKNNVPLVIMSSSALGGEAISECLKREKHWFDNIHIIGNSFMWDENGKAVDVKEPIIHGMNKFETAIQNYPAYEKVKEKHNVILLGDNPGDVGMVEGFEYKNLIKIGFLNEKIEDQLEHYKKHYDVIITNDGTFDFINELLQKIL